jgi:hypothetical protein
VSGTFAIGTVSVDSLGAPKPTAGNFSTRITGAVLELVWTPSTATPCQVWQAANFGANASNPAIAGPTADPDGDAILNLLEYGLNLDPNVAHRGDLPTVSRSAGNVVLSFRKNTAATDLTYSVEWSDDLDTWSVTGVTITPGAITGSTQSMSGSVAESSSGKRFLRLRVTK